MDGDGRNDCLRAVQKPQDWDTKYLNSSWFDDLIGFMTKKILSDMLLAFERGVHLVPAEIELTNEEVGVFVRMKIDPKRFSPNMFDGDWAFTNQHPIPGKIRVLKAITGNDGISRLLVRQGRFVYAYPWFK